MSERKLTTEEIELIYDFCYDRDVSEYEIQVELVDHLASAIEEKWKINPEISFFDNLFEIYHRFGPDDFKKLAKSKKRAFQKQYNRLFIRFIISFFQLPRIILTFAFSFFLFAFIRYFDAREAVMYSIQGFSLASFLWYTFFFFPGRLAIKVKKEQKFLFINYLNTLKALSNLLIICSVNAINMSFRHFKAPETVWFDFGLSFTVIVFFIVGYAFMFYMPLLMKQHFNEEFPQFVKS